MFCCLLVIVPLGFVGKVAKEYFTSAIRLIIPAAGFIFFMQAFFQPVGDTVIFKFWFLDVTQESLSFAFRIAMRITVMISAFTLFLLTTHPSELMSDLTRRGLPRNLPMSSFQLCRSFRKCRQKRKPLSPPNAHADWIRKAVS